MKSRTNKEPMTTEMNLIDSANRKLIEFDSCIELKRRESHAGPLYAGVDLGTANIVTAVVDGEGNPVAGVLTQSRSSIRDGLVLDYIGAINLLRQQVLWLHANGYPIDYASAAFPPGTTGRNAESFGNVLRAVSLEVANLVDEPSAAAKVLEITDGCVVDIGGGTTGVSILEHGEVIYTADEATGGVHLDLVIAGNYGISLEEAEQLKRDPARQDHTAILVRPVFEKMGSIVRQHIQGRGVENIYLVGGASQFPGADQIIEGETGVNVIQPVHPLLVTPLGIALCCREALNSR